MGRRSTSFVSQPFLGSPVRLLSRFMAMALAGAFATSAPAWAGAASATLQVRARIVSSCAVSSTAFHGNANSNQGRFNCPVPNSAAPMNPLGPAPQGATADYTITELPASDGNFKLVTFTF